MSSFLVRALSASSSGSGLRTCAGLGGAAGHGGGAGGGGSPTSSTGGGAGAGRAGALAGGFAAGLLAGGRTASFDAFFGGGVGAETETGAAGFLPGWNVR